MVTKEVIVTMRVKVEYDETKITPAFIREFKESFYQFDTVDQHVEHLAQLNARGIAHDYAFIEGYGPAQEFGLKFDNEVVEIEIQQPAVAA